MNPRDFQVIAEVLASERISDGYADFQNGREFSRVRLAGMLAECFSYHYGTGFDSEDFLARADVEISHEGEVIEGEAQPEIPYFSVELRGDFVFLPEARLG